ncbi:MAG: FKBP-type peptidyl-prolyl cis-trans isomerase [Succinivibrio sp.]
MLNTLLKKTAMASALAVSVLSLSACEHKISVLPSDVIISAKAIDEKSSFEDKAAYAIGASLGTYVASMKAAQERLVGKLPSDKIISGFNDGLGGAPLLEREEIEAVLKQLDQKLQEKIDAEQKQASQHNLELGQQFLAENAKKDGVVTTQSGLQYKVITKGEGATPKKGDTISVTYKGTTIDGFVFDEQKNPVEFKLDNMIQGWIEGLQLMNEGSEYELYIPSSLAYGEQGAGEMIKPNSVLVFNVKLIAVKSAASEEPKKESK